MQNVYTLTISAWGEAHGDYAWILNTKTTSCERSFPLKKKERKKTAPPQSHCCTNWGDLWAFKMKAIFSVCFRFTASTLHKGNRSVSTLKSNYLDVQISVRKKTGANISPRTSYVTAQIWETKAYEAVLICPYIWDERENTLWTLESTVF